MLNSFKWLLIHSQLSIYPSPDPEVHLEEVHTDLERQIGNVREQATEAYVRSGAVLQSAVSRWINIEESVESACRPVRCTRLFVLMSSRADKVKEIVPKDESITPGILYVGVATLAGSVFARNRTKTSALYFCIC